VADTASIGEAGGTANGTAGAALSSTTSGVTALNVLTNDTDANVGDTKVVSAILKGTTGTATAVNATTTSANGQSVVGPYSIQFPAHYYLMCCSQPKTICQQQLPAL
jgi:hypothetical protein